MTTEGNLGTAESISPILGEGKVGYFASDSAKVLDGSFTENINIGAGSSVSVLVYNNGDTALNFTLYGSSVAANILVPPKTYAYFTPYRDSAINVQHGIVSADGTLQQVKFQVSTVSGAEEEIDFYISHLFVS